MSQSERGSAAIATVMAMGLLLTIVALFVQVAVWQYTRGAVRAAINDAVRAQAPHLAEPGACEATFSEVRSSLLGGSIGDQVGDVRCSDDGLTVAASVDVALDGWLPLLPGWDFTVSASAVKEHPPT